MTAGKLKIDIRRKKILELLRLEGKISVTDIANVLNVTPVTIRTDLSVLEQEGQLMRVQGGAVQVPQKVNTLTLEQSRAVVSNAEQKLAIGAAVAKMIQDGDTLFVNSGTTSEFIASALSTRINLNVVTNSLKVATRLGAVPSFRVLLIGGEINSQYGFTYGGDAQEQLSKYQADWALLSVDGVSAKGGVTTHHAEEAIIDRMMAAAARQKVIVADAGKIGRAGFSRVCECTGELMLVTNQGGDKTAVEELQECGMKIISA